MGSNPSTLRVRPRVGGFIMPRSGRASGFPIPDSGFGTEKKSPLLLLRSLNW
jgi:hypothetical protein